MYKGPAQACGDCPSSPLPKLFALPGIRIDIPLGEGGGYSTEMGAYQD